MNQKAKTQTGTGNFRLTISPAEVEQLYGIPVGTLANLRCKRRGPRFFKVQGGKVIYRVADIEAWLFANPVLTIDQQGASND